MPSADRSPRVLIARLSAIGDVVLSMPLACALRDRFPGALIGWVVERPAAPLLECHEAIDELFVVPKGWLGSLGEMRRLCRRLRAAQFEIAVDPQSLTKSAVVGVLSGARRRIGFARPRGRELAPWLNNERVVAAAPHVVDRQLELLRPLGVESPAVRFGYGERPEEARAAEAFLGEWGLAAGFAIINPGASWASKLWPAERYAAVARHVARRWNLPLLIVWGGAAEKALAERIAGETSGAARPAPPSTLRQLASWARRARLFLSADTGPLHLAAAVGAPCVGLFGPWPAEECGPYGSGNVAVQRMRFDGPSRARRRAPPIYMESIHVESVCEACDRVLGRTPVRTSES